MDGTAFQPRAAAPASVSGRTQRTKKSRESRTSGTSRVSTGSSKSRRGMAMGAAAAATVLEQPREEAPLEPLPPMYPPPDMARVDADLRATLQKLSKRFLNALTALIDAAAKWYPDDEDVLRYRALAWAAIQDATTHEKQLALMTKFHELFNTRYPLVTIKDGQCFVAKADDDDVVQDLLQETSAHERFAFLNAKQKASVWDLLTEMVATACLLEMRIIAPSGMVQALMGMVDGMAEVSKRGDAAADAFSPMSFLTKIKNAMTAEHLAELQANLAARNGEQTFQSLYGIMKGSDMGAIMKTVTGQSVDEIAAANPALKEASTAMLNVMGGAMTAIRPPPSVTVACAGAGAQVSDASTAAAECVAPDADAPAATSAAAATSAELAASLTPQALQAAADSTTASWNDFMQDVRSKLGAVSLTSVAEGDEEE